MTTQVKNTYRTTVQYNRNGSNTNSRRSTLISFTNYRHHPKYFENCRFENYRRTYTAYKNTVNRTATF